MRSARADGGRGENHPPRLAGGHDRLRRWPCCWGRGWIAWLRRRFREPIKSDSPEVVRLHRGKQSTPTMGGLFIVAGLVGGTLLFGDLHNGYVAPALVVAGGLTAVGIVDDLVKLRTAGNGLRSGSKFAGATARRRAWPPRCSISSRPPLPDGLSLRLPLVGERRVRSGYGSCRWR